MTNEQQYGLPENPPWICPTCQLRAVKHRWNDQEEIIGREIATNRYTIAWCPNGHEFGWWEPIKSRPLGVRYG